MRLVRLDRLDTGEMLADPAHHELRRRVFLAVQARFDGASLYEAGKAHGFTKKKMRDYWKRNKYHGRPLILTVTDS